jgi:hypothetical protein
MMRVTLFHGVLLPFKLQAPMGLNFAKHFVVGLEDSFGIIIERVLGHSRQVSGFYRVHQPDSNNGVFIEIR